MAPVYMDHEEIAGKLLMHIRWCNCKDLWYLIPFIVYYYRPQTKFVKVMFLQVCVCPQGWGHVWQGRGVHGGGHAWWGCVCDRGACLAGETATAAGGTYPNGMHNCELWNFNMNQCRLSLTLRGAVYKYNFSLRWHCKRESESLAIVNEPLLSILIC